MKEVIEIRVIDNKGNPWVIGLGDGVKELKENIWSPEPYCHRFSIIVVSDDDSEIEFMGHAIDYVKRR